MKTIRGFAFVAVMLSLLTAMTPRLYGAETTEFTTYADLAGYYQQQRAWKRAAA